MRFYWFTIARYPWVSNDILSRICGLGKYAISGKIHRIGDRMSRTQ